MSDSRFDETLRKILNTHTENFENSNWDLMNERLDGEAMLDGDVESEEIIRNKLNA